MIAKDETKFHFFRIFFRFFSAEIRHILTIFFSVYLLTLSLQYCCFSDFIFFLFVYEKKCVPSLCCKMHQFVFILASIATAVVTFYRILSEKWIFLFSCQLNTRKEKNYPKNMNENLNLFQLHYIFLLPFVLFLHL